MTAVKAIEILKIMKKVCRNLFPGDEQDALSLGIEALKREKRFRFMHPMHNEGLLPGETEE